MDTFDLCIVGAGMIGSAAARHATLTPGIRVCLIGPEEPESRSLGDGRDIYGAYYDEGRITRQADKDPVWAVLAQKSIQRYRQLERESGIRFYSEVGNLMVGTEGGSFVKSVNDTVRRRHIDFQTFGATGLAERFPYLKLGPKDQGIYESRNAGTVSPRNLVRAEQKLASNQGCTILNDIVSQVTRIVQSDGSYVMKVTTDQGRVVISRKVLLATGAFTTFRDLLPEIEPAQLLCPLTVAKVEISYTDAGRLRHMPCVIYEGEGHPDWYQSVPRVGDGLYSYYLLPPIKYPDGKYYVKLGTFHGCVAERCTTKEEVKTWFCTGNKQLADVTAKLIMSLFKGVKAKSFHGDYCVIVETETDRPYIDKVHAQLGVAIGGNGYAAKSCDEIGRVGAQMLLKGWDSEIPQEDLRLRLKSREKAGTKSML